MSCPCRRWPRAPWCRGVAGPGGSPAPRPGRGRGWSSVLRRLVSGQRLPDEPHEPLEVGVALVVRAEGPLGRGPGLEALEPGALPPGHDVRGVGVLAGVEARPP